MKKIYLIVAMLALGVSALQAQGNFKVYAGVAFPNGKFADLKDASSFALLSGQKYGGAGLGATAGISYRYNVASMNGVSIMGSANVMYNPLSSDANDMLDEQEAAVKSTISRPNYFNIPLMVGAHYGHPLNDDVTLYVEGQLGVNIRIITEMEEEVGSSTDVIEYDNATSFAYQLGAGLELKGKYSVSVEYYNLGAAKLKGKITSSGSSTKLSGSNLAPTVVALRLGYMF